jgi:hypothetical protein
MKPQNIMKTILLANLLMLFALGLLHAQNSVFKVIKAGKLIDTENGKILSDQMILIENDTIKAVGTNIPGH